MNKYKLNVGIVGLGTVGSGVIKLLKKQKHNIKNRTGIELRVVAITAKNRRNCLWWIGSKLNSWYFSTW